MHFIRLYLLTCAFVRVSARNSLFKKWYQENILQAMIGCIPRFVVPSKDLTDLLGGYVPKEPNTRCLLSCAYKKEGTFTTIGYYNTYHLQERAYEFKHKNESMLSHEKELLIEDAVAMGDKCWNVNVANVSDGTRGCERAALLFKCFQHNNDHVLDRDFKLTYIYSVERAKITCLQDSHYMTQDVMNELMEGNNPTKQASNCLLACAFKYEGTMTSTGYYNPQHIVDMAYKFLKLNQNVHERSMILFHAQSMAKRCEKVNLQNVSDKNRGCERAALILKCRKDHGKKEFGDY